jgi:acetoin utilization deacetylase AcuC-like enzyme
MMPHRLRIVLPSEPLVAASTTLDFNGRTIATNETNERLSALVSGFEAAQSCDFMTAAARPPLVEEYIYRTHAKSYVDQLRAVCATLNAAESQLIPQMTAPGLDAETMVSRRSYDAAFRSAAAALEAASGLDGRHRMAFAACRPPGHHAGHAWLGGYCYLNNAAIACRFLSDRTGRTGAILDLDFHYPNGTADIIGNSDSCFLGSIHCETTKTFPFARVPDRIGRDRFCIGLAQPPQGGHYLSLVDEMVKRALAFGSAYLVVSLGFDTVAGDPFGGWDLQPEIFCGIGEIFADCAVPVCFVFEGGYELRNLERCSRCLAEGIANQGGSDARAGGF